MASPAPLPDPRRILEEAAALRPFIVDLVLRVCRERTVNYFEADFPGAEDAQMTRPEIFERSPFEILIDDCRRDI